MNGSASQKCRTACSLKGIERSYRAQLRDNVRARNDDEETAD